MHTDTLVDPRAAQQRVRAAVNQILDQARAGADRRAEPRHPFFRPVTITVEDEPGNPQLFTAFTRELSPLGMGLLHSRRLEPGEVVVTLSGDGTPPVHLRLQIIWCRPSMDGWYLSGGRFVDLARKE